MMKMKGTGGRFVPAVAKSRNPLLRAAMLLSLVIGLCLAPGFALDAPAYREMIADATLTVSAGQTDDWNAFLAALDSAAGLRQADMYAVRLTRAQMAELSARYPRVTFGWTLRIGEHTVRTDATAFSTLHDRTSDPHASEDFAVLKYCKNLMALDVGHNAITDLTFLESLPKLKILILGRNRLSELTPIGKLAQLEYLELFSDGITDVSALASCKNLLDVNLTNNRIGDLTPVLTLPRLQRLWLYRSTGVLSQDRFSAEEKSAILSAVPAACQVNFTSSGTGGGWRDHARYETLFEIFHTGVYRAW